MNAHTLPVPDAAFARMARRFAAEIDRTAQERADRAAREAADDAAQWAAYREGQRGW